MARYAVWLADASGRRLRFLDKLETLDYMLVTNGPGSVVVTTTGLTPDDVQRDYQIHVERAPDENTPLRLQRVFFVRDWRFNIDSRGVTRCTLVGPCQAELLNRRIIAYATGSSGSGKTDNIDDVMKALVRENLGSSAPAARDITAHNFSVAADTSQGTSITKAFAWKPLLQTLQELHESSTQGTLIWFDVAISGVDKNGVPSFEFRTYAGQPGVDRRFKANNNTGSFYFSTNLGNVANPELATATSDEANYIYAGGRGRLADRDVQEISDDDAIAASPYNRREVFTSAVHQNTSGAVQGEGYERLRNRRAREVFSANLLDTADSRYGIDWGLGDYVTVREFGRTFDGIIRKIRARVGPDGREDLSAWFDSGAPLTEPLARVVERQRALEQRVATMETAEDNNYRNTTSGSDLTTSQLHRSGDYGFRTDTNQLQINVGGVIKKITYT